MYYILYDNTQTVHYNARKRRKMRRALKHEPVYQVKYDRENNIIIYKTIILNTLINKYKYDRTIIEPKKHEKCIMNHDKNTKRIIEVDKKKNINITIDENIFEDITDVNDIPNIHEFNILSEDMIIDIEPTSINSDDEIIDEIFYMNEIMDDSTLLTDQSILNEDYIDIGDTFFGLIG